MTCDYPHIFEPLKVGSITLKNRIIAAPVGKLFNWMSPSDDFEVFASKARGGAALVIIGCVFVDDERGAIVPQDLTIKANLPVHNELVSIVHQYGSKISAELVHCGMFANPLPGSRNPIGPDTFVREPGDYRGIPGVENNDIMDGKTVYGMTLEDMNEVADAYANAAVMAKRVGYDMCFLHFGHGWLPAQFLSPFFNHRTDEFGGCLENRMRFPKMIIERVREAVGKDYPLDMRISAYEYVEGGIQPSDVIQFIQSVEDKIDMVHISSGIDKFLHTTAFLEAPSVYPKLLNVKFSEEVKKAVKIPVCVVGSIGKPEDIEQIISEGKADAVAMARALIADPDLPNKAQRGKADEIVPCLRCVNCYHVATEGISQGCSVNPSYGRIARLNRQITKAEEPKRVVVVGGGPAGMKAAITAAERGHEVFLFEKEKELGGLLRICHTDAAKYDMRGYEEYLIKKTYKANINLKLGVEATPEMIEELQPDRVIVALGSTPVTPPIPGIEQDHVMNIVQAHYQPETIGKNVVIIGGGQSGCELALFLASEGHKVTLIEMSNELCCGSNVIYKQAVKDLIAGNDHIDCRLNARCVKINTKSALICQSGDEFEISADTVVYAVGMRAREEEANAFAKVTYDVRIVGDCQKPRRITEATHEGFFAGATI